MNNVLTAVLLFCFIFAGAGIGLPFDENANRGNEWLMQLQNPDKQFGKKAVQKREVYKTPSKPPESAAQKKAVQQSRQQNERR